MSYETIIVSKEDKLAGITFNRPEKRNAMNGKMLEELSTALGVLAHDDSISVLMINGNGDHFCAGADISWMKSAGTLTDQENRDDAQVLANLLFQLHKFPKPTIALAHGAVLGGGMGIMSVCDIAIAATDASFGFPEVKIGLAPSTISPYVLKAIGERQALYYFLTGTRFDADKAQKIGLIHQVTEVDELYKSGSDIAQVLMKNGPQALVAIKQLVRQVSQENIDHDIGKFTADHLATLRATDEAHEGLKAFLEKRAPNWSEG